MTSETTRICFIRHGETDWNIEERMQGQLDQALNARGEAQALALGRHFSNCAAAALYSSDLLRARQTAQPIGDVLRLPLRLDPALRERHFGRCEGLTLAEVAVQHAEDALAFASRDPDYAAPGGGESRRQHRDRVLACIARLAAAHRAQSIVIVTHGGVLDVIYRQARDLPADAPRDYPIPNAGINWVVAGRDGWQIESWGETP
jgi:2,3-bisphosphoglycerate-dependent phosphoglycerate mutase